MIARTPAHDVRAEREVVGGVLLEPSALADLLLTPADFYVDRNSLIFAAQRALAARNDAIDTTTVRAELLRAGTHARVGDEYLLALTDTIPTITNIQHHAAIVAAHASVRRVVRAAALVVAEGYEPVEDAQSYSARAEASILAACAGLPEERKAQHVSAIVHDYVQRILARLPGGTDGYRTGLVDLDFVLDGIGPELIVIAGRPGSGKTALSVQIATTIAIDYQVPALICSAEMSSEQIVQRMIASRARIDTRSLRSLRLNQDEAARLFAGAADLEQHPIYLYDQPGMTTREIRRQCARVERTHGKLGLVVIDYAQLVASYERADNREQEVARIVRDCNALKKIYGCPVLLCAQLNREVDKRADKRPQLSDLRESGSLEQDADTVLLLYNDSYYTRNSELAGIVEVDLGKSRHGPRALVRLGWSGSHTRFFDLSGGQ